MAVTYSNDAATTLNSALTTSTNTFTVATGTGASFPALGPDDHFYVTLLATGKNEIVRVTARAADVFTIERAQDGSTAFAFDQGDIVELRITKGLMDDIQEDASNEAMAMAIALG